MIQRLQNLLPRACLFCHATTHRSLALCQHCEAELPWLKNTCQQCALPLAKDSGSLYCGDCLSHPKAFDKTTALFYYAPPIRKLISQLKYHQQLMHAHFFANIFIQHLKQPLPQAILPVPLHKKRLRQRGYNQAVEIARPIAHRFNIPILLQHCIKNKTTTPQTQLPAKQRRNNIRGSFKISKPIYFAHVAILDDVMTTGSTINELAKTLKKQGVTTIEAWCCARSYLS